MAEGAGTAREGRNVLRAELERLVQIEDGELEQPLADVGDATVAVSQRTQGGACALIFQHPRAGLDPGVRTLTGGAIAPVGFAGCQRLATPENDRKNETRAAHHGSSLLLHGEPQSYPPIVAAPSRSADPPFRLAADGRSGQPARARNAR